MQALIDNILAANDDKFVNDSMVCQFWNDGEITLQKGGDLFGNRSLHCIFEAAIPDRHPLSTTLKNEMPHKQSNGYAFIFCESTDKALEFRNQMLELLR